MDIANNSKASGLNFCLGNWTAMGTDILAAIRHFGERGQIVYGHAQGVQGTVPKFQECFLDEADCDFLAVLQAFKEVGFDSAPASGTLSTHALRKRDWRAGICLRSWVSAGTTEGSWILGVGLTWNRTYVGGASLPRLGGQMQYRRFGKTNWQVSEIGLGGSWFYGRPEFGLKPFSYGARIVERALELEINYFDTAPLYGQGRSEEVLGAALKGVTEPYYLATKVGYYPEPFDYTRDTVWRGFEASLKRLQRDKVDLLQIHEAEQAGWDGIFGAGRTLETLLEIQEQGLTQHIGLTGSDLELMRDVLKESDVFVSVITFLKYDLLTQQAKEILVPTAAERDVAVITASPLHAGLLGSKRELWMQNSRFADLYDKLEQVEVLLADQPEDITHIALRYLLSDSRVSILLSGVASIEELETSVSVADGHYLPPELIAQIEAIK